MALAAWTQTAALPAISVQHPDADPVEVARGERFKQLACVDLWDVPFVVVDIETTGSIIGRDGITEIALVAVQCGRILKRWRSFVNPFQPIPQFITHLTGISDDMVRHAPPARELLGHITEFIGDAVLVGHNVRFDAHFIDAELCRHGNRPLSNVKIDTLALARRTIAEVANYKLGTLTRELGIDVERHHRALADAAATAELLIRCVKKLEDCAVFTLGSLFDYLQVRNIPRRRANVLKRAADPSQLPVWTTVLMGELPDVPAKPGVYALHDASGAVVYVGKSRNLRQRLRAYATLGRPAGPKMSALRSVVASFTFTVTGSEFEALLLEAEMVRAHNPPFNDRLRDFREFGFIKMELGAQGRLLTTTRLCADGARYYGPYRSMSAARAAVAALTDALGLHSEDQMEAPVPLPPAQREAMLAEAAAFLEGRADEVLLSLARRRDEAAARARHDLTEREEQRLQCLRRLRERHAALELGMALNALVMAPSVEPGEEACFLFCGGRLVAQSRLPRRLPERSRAQQLLAAMFAQSYMPDGAARWYVKQEEIDQLFIFSAWYRERREGLYYALLPERRPTTDEAMAWSAAILDGEAVEGLCPAVDAGAAASAAGSTT